MNDYPTDPKGLRIQERDLLNGALAAFNRATGLVATITEAEPLIAWDHRPDAFITVTPQEGQAAVLVAEVKTTLDRVIALAAAKQQLAPYEKRGLLVVPYLAAELATVCREKLHLQFMDAAGNAFIDQPGIFVYIKGEKPKEARAPQEKGGTATRLRIVFALLCKPDLLNAPYREIAAVAGVALGTVGWAFFDLNARGFTLGGKQATGRHLVEPKRVLDEWVTNYAIKLRPKLNAQRFHAPNTNWWNDVNLVHKNAYWGGEVAADRLTGYLKPAKYTIYVDPKERREFIAQLAAAQRLQADDNGNIEILDTFWRFPKDRINPDVAPPILIYADLMATLDPRNIEVATLIREKYIDNA